MSLLLRIDVFANYVFCVVCVDLQGSYRPDDVTVYVSGAPRYFVSCLFGADTAKQNQKVKQHFAGRSSTTCWHITEGVELNIEPIEPKIAKIFKRPKNREGGLILAIFAPNRPSRRSAYFQKNLNDRKTIESFESIERSPAALILLGRSDLKDSWEPQDLPAEILVSHHPRRTSANKQTWYTSSGKKTGCANIF